MRKKTAARVDGEPATHHVVLVAVEQINRLADATPCWVNSIQAKIAFVIDEFLKTSRSNGNGANAAERPDDTGSE